MRFLEQNEEVEKLFSIMFFESRLFLLFVSQTRDQMLQIPFCPNNFRFKGMEMKMEQI
jgi:hypothetical protein